MQANHTSRITPYLWETSIGRANLFERELLTGRSFIVRVSGAHICTLLFLVYFRIKELHQFTLFGLLREF